MTANRKRIGDAAELKEQRRLESEGWAVFPLSPSFEGVDLIAVRDGWIALVEVKSSRLYGQERVRALQKLMDAAQYLRDLAEPYNVTQWLVEGDG